MNFEKCFCTFALLHICTYKHDFILHFTDAKMACIFSLRESWSFMAGKSKFQERKVGVSLALQKWG